MKRLRVRFAKETELKFISHLDLLRTLVRALRRSGVPVAYSQGFNRKPRVVIAAPLPLGATSTGEYCDIFLEEAVPALDFQAKVAQELPRGLKLLKTFAVPLEEPPLPSLIAAALYRCSMPGGLPLCWTKKIEKLLSCSELIVLRHTRKRGSKKVDLRPFIFSLKIKENGGNNGSFLEMLLATGSMGGAKPSEILSLLGKDNNNELYNLHRSALYFRREGLFREPEELITT